MTIVQRGVDYSWARPGGAAIRAAGFTFAMRYVPYPGDGGKGLTREELADLHGHGVAVGLVFESISSMPLLGRAGGIYDGDRTLAGIGTLGWPQDRPVYFAVDFDAQPDQYAVIDQYLEGAASMLTLDRVGVYGSFDVVDHCLAVGTARWAWQTYAWSRGAKHPRRHIYQYRNGETLNGGAVDYNEGYGADFGQWPVGEREGTMSDDDLLAVFAGSEETDDQGALLSREERLAKARYRRDEAAAGRAPSVRELAIVANGGLVTVASVRVPDHEHFSGAVIR